MNERLEELRLERITRELKHLKRRQGLVSLYRPHTKCECKDARVNSEAESKGK